MGTQFVGLFEPVLHNLFIISTLRFLIPQSKGPTRPFVIGIERAMDLSRDSIM